MGLSQSVHLWGPVLQLCPKACRDLLRVEEPEGPSVQGVAGMGSHGDVPEGNLQPWGQGCVLAKE